MPWWLLLAAQTVDPAAWGASHAGKPVPEFVHGEECLFCHRNDIGPGWQKNAHGTTIRVRQDDPARFLLGGRFHTRQLRKETYGTFSLLMPSGEWDKTRFFERCAGCHATGVDAKTRTFAYYGLDCYTCHGVVDLKHSEDTSLVLLSRKRRDDARVVTSICASCHLRGGRSKSTGRPYPDNFVPGDNLFKDFQIDWKTPGEDVHVWRSVRDGGTCLTCHTVHTGSKDKHRRVLSGPICNDCHYEGRPRKEVRPLVRRSAVCEY